MIAMAVAVAGTASAGVYATTLRVTANQDFAATVELSACQASSVSIQSDDRVFDDTRGLWTISGFTTSGIPAACRGILYVSAVTKSGTQIEQFTTPLYGTDTLVHFAFASPQPENDLGPYAVAVHG